MSEDIGAFGILETVVLDWRRLLGCVRFLGVVGGC